ncbi:MAG: DNA polymerase III subunit gamma/tau [Oscillospiraceae bacterium]|nr:DNA polymerase III subunit gamma/tau [Oscillospiraceae bacterium]
MYRALYRKWRPSRFEDVVGQQPIVTALKNQVATSRIGHAYLFTGTRGTGKTTCAKIFAKAVNCPHQEGGDPCCQCDICRGIENGSILDVVEIDAASNNGVDNIRDIRDETAYTPSECTYKVYIIDEVHMLSMAAFNALLKIMEEPPSHVIFILATTEIHKVPATILSRCQRYDFGRIQPQDIAARLLYIAGEEQIGLTPEAADLIARLADGALRDALSILDTCVGVSTQVDAELVRRMSGVTDRGYLFEISAGVHNRDSAGVLAQVATLRQRSVDMKRLCEELINHYRNLMLAALPGGGALLTGVPPEEESRYMQMAGEIPQAESIRAIQALGSAMERMSRGTDQRIELELALFSLTEPVAPAAQPAAAAPFVSAPAAPISSTWAPKAPEPAQPAAQQPPQQPEPAAAPAPVQEEDLPPWEVDEPLSPKTLPEKEIPTPAPAAPVPQPAPSAAPADTLMLYPQWHDVVEVLLSSELPKQEPALIPYLRTSKAYFDGKRVLIDGGDVFRDFLRRSPESRVHIKDIIEEKTGVRCPIGPYTPPKADQPQAVANVEELLARMQAQGVDVIIEEKK